MRLSGPALWKLPEPWTHRTASTAPWKTTEQVFHRYHRAPSSPCFLGEHPKCQPVHEIGATPTLPNPQSLNPGPASEPSLLESALRNPFPHQEFSILVCGSVRDER